MFGAIPFSVYRDISRSQGVMIQLDLDLGCPPWYFINPEFLGSLPKVLTHYSPAGAKYGSMGTVDHPSFAQLRDHLETKGYIHTQRNSCNGDTVLEPFYLNNYLLMPGETFYSGAAMRNTKEIINGYNDGQIDPTVKNYRDDYNPEYCRSATKIKERLAKGDDWW